MSRRPHESKTLNEGEGRVECRERSGRHDFDTTRNPKIRMCVEKEQSPGNVNVKGSGLYEREDKVVFIEKKCPGPKGRGE